MIQIIKELFNSKLKCNRVGHNLKTQNLRIRKLASPYHYRAVVIDYEATREVCKRCGLIGELKEGSEKDWYTSCSMPDVMWNEIHKNGYTIM